MTLARRLQKETSEDRLVREVDRPVSAGAIWQAKRPSHRNGTRYNSTSREGTPTSSRDCQ
jgi:hypothetical protein